MTNFLRRIVDLIRASLNSLIEKAEDPEKMLEQMMRDMQTSYERSKVEVARVLAEKHRLAGQLQRSRREAEDWERKAILALKAGDESLARKALERKRASTELAEGFQTQLADQEAAAEKLKHALVGLDNKLAEARVKRQLLLARHQRALAHKKIHKALEASGSTTAFDSLARLESRIDQLEADSMAVAEISEGSLDEKFRQLDVSDVEDDLLLLKARLIEPDRKALGQARPQALPPAGE